MGSNTKILFVGYTDYDMYVRAFFNAARNMSGIDAYLFDFRSLNSDLTRNNIFLRVEKHYKIGPHVLRYNKNLIDYVADNKIDIVFLYACDIIRAITVKKLSKLCYVAIYNNDNPFSDYFPKYQWKNVVNSLKYADIVYSYRLSNIQQYINNGAKRVKLMRSYYISDRNYYIQDELIDIEVPDVCYIGHYENDGRVDYLKSLMDSGIDVGVPEEWKKYSFKHDHLIYISDTYIKYNEVLNKAKIAIVFLSTINKDTYTRRCFEIPIVKTLMVAPYNEDIKSLFEDGKEVILYKDKEDLMKKIHYYLQNVEERLMIAEAGYNRVMKDGHEAANRVQAIIDDYKDAMKI